VPTRNQVTGEASDPRSGFRNYQTNRRAPLPLERTRPACMDASRSGGMKLRSMGRWGSVTFSVSISIYLSRNFRPLIGGRGENNYCPASQPFEVTFCIILAGPH
jgi:hypothetical protein